MAKRFSPLRLLAADADDLQIVSAALQDAVAKLGDFEFSKSSRSFTLALNRYVWEAGGRRQRVRSGLQIGAVLAARSHRLKQGVDNAVVSLLSIGFDPASDPDAAPAGEIVLTFSGGGELRLAVECIDAAMADLSMPWPAQGRPDHSETA